MTHSFPVRLAVKKDDVIGFGSTVAIYRAKQSSDNSRPTTPTTIRITPTVSRLTPETCAVIAYFRIAPTAIRKIEVPIPT